MKIVYTITERDDKTYWTRVGIAYTNRDGSLIVKLDAIPVNVNLIVKDKEVKSDSTNSNQEFQCPYCGSSRD